MKRRSSNYEYPSAREWAAKLYRAGKASQVISPFDIKPGDRVYLAVRKSSCDRRDNLYAQEANLRTLVEARGGIIVGVYRYVGSGFDPWWVGCAAAKAKRAGAVALIAECTDRFIRNRYYHSVHRPLLQATDQELTELAECSNGIQLMTYLHPDTPAMECRAFQIKRGQREKCRAGGRPLKRRPGYKQHRQWEHILEVRRDRRRGLSIRKIAAKFNIPKSTICEWING